MNTLLQPVYRDSESPRFSGECIVCGQRGLILHFDQAGKPFKAYYCGPCGDKALLKEKARRGIRALERAHAQ